MENMAGPSSSRAEASMKDKTAPWHCKTGNSCCNKLDIACEDGLCALHLSATEEKNVQDALQGRASLLFLVHQSTYGVQLNPEHFSCLEGNGWVNDEVVNAFIVLTNARNFDVLGDMSREERFARVREVNSPCTHCNVFDFCRPRSYIVSSFFYSRLTKPSYDFERVRKWPNGCEVYRVDLLLFPVNIGNRHWVLAAIDFRRRRFIYFDSLWDNDNARVLENIKTWLRDRTREKHGEIYMRLQNYDSWNTEINPCYTPRQRDSNSCGVLMMFLAEHVSRGSPPCFAQADVPTLRKRALLHIMKGELPPYKH